MTSTSLLSYSCFFFPLVEVGLIELVVLLATLLVEGIKEVGGKEEEEVVEGGDNSNEEEQVEEERLFFNFSIYILEATSLRRALTSSTSPFRISIFYFSFFISFIEGFSPTIIFYTLSLIYLTCSLLPPSSLR